MLERFKYWLGFNQKQNKEDTTTIVGADTFIEISKFDCNDDLEVHGILHGDVQIKNNLCIIAKTGSIEGSIQAKEVVIAGLVKGDIICTGTVYITGTGKVDGFINTRMMIVDDGAIITGMCEIGYISETKKIPNVAAMAN